MWILKTYGVDNFVSKQVGLFEISRIRFAFLSYNENVSKEFTSKPSSGHSFGQFHIS